MMKNWLPFVFGPALAMASGPRLYPSRNGSSPSGAAPPPAAGAGAGYCLPIWCRFLVLCGSRERVHARRVCRLVGGDGGVAPEHVADLIGPFQQHALGEGGDVEGQG